MKLLRPKLRRFWTKIRQLATKHPRAVKVGAVLVVMFAVYIGSKSVETVTKVIHIAREGEFHGARVFGGTEAAVYEAKERNLSKIAGDLLSGQRKTSEDVQKMTARVVALEAKSVQASTNPPAQTKDVQGNPDGQLTTGAVNHSPGEQTGRPPVASFTSEIVRGTGSYATSLQGPSSGFMPSSQRIAARGPDVITFPVASEEPKEELGIVIPSGSYVKAKIIAGTDATTGEPDPVLLQLDYSNVLPNQRKIDLSGCFVTAKAQANLSTERVKMKTMKLSCVSKHGMVFEKDINGFVDDDLDNKFGVSGIVNSKQDRVAAMAFLASVVEGVGKAVQQAQTTQQTTPLGGDQSTMTGDQKKYLAGGAAANAAGVVANWYLKQAESLLPSISVGSGRDVWVVVLDSVTLPKDYFMKGPSDARYSYVTRVLD